MKIINKNNPIIELVTKHYIALLLFAFAFIFIPLNQLNYLNLMPGDLGDARLNNYFLENIFQFFKGQSSSLIHLAFYYPYPYVGGFSDNLYGASPIYILPRIIGIETDTAFQMWFLFSYFVNYFSSYYVLRRLKFSHISASFGALIFSFALPVSVRQGHAQLSYRFGVPLATLFFIFFLKYKNWRYFLISGWWLLWQYYCSIYIGFFTTILITACFASFWWTSSKSPNFNMLNHIKGLVSSFRQLTRTKKRLYIGTMGVIAISIFALFYPYLQVSSIYKFKRDSSEIATMLPRPESYFYTSISSVYKSSADIYKQLPMKHEHQMFFGFSVLFFILIGCFYLRKKTSNFTVKIIAISFLIIALSTLSYQGYSLWLWLVGLPLFSAIRAMARIDLIMLFPVSVISAYGMENIKNYLYKDKKVLFLALSIISFVISIWEFSMVKTSLSSKDTWRKRIEEKEKLVPSNLSNNNILFFSNTDPFIHDEIDAMWVGIKNGIPVLNGYTGWMPNGYKMNFGQNINELPKRLLSYQSFSHELSHKKSYDELVSRVVPIGFSICIDDYKKYLNNCKIHRTTTTSSVYTKDLFKNLKTYILGKKLYGDQNYIIVKITNDSDTAFSCISMVNKPIRVSWRFTDANSKPLSGWDARADLPFDIPPRGSVNVYLPISSNYLNLTTGDLQVSLVQEGLFWLHDLGVEPSSQKWIEIKTIY